MNKIIHREIEVAFSRHAQPLWFRIMKWVIIISLAYFLWNTPYLWWVMGILLIPALCLHFYYRYKTKAWTQSYGMWNYERNKPKVKES
jgi:hypothetical protein